MRKSTSQNEIYVGLSWLAKQMQLHRYKVHYRAVKMRLRTFNFSTVRYIELENAICLVQNFEPALTDEVYERVIELLENMRDDT